MELLSWRGIDFPLRQGTSIAVGQAADDDENDINDPHDTGEAT